MKNTLINQALEIVQDPYLLVNIVSQRVKNISINHKGIVQNLPTSMTLGDYVLQEIIDGKLAVTETEQD